jgi:type II secretory pathway component GspD/PulD (secretin)
MEGAPIVDTRRADTTAMIKDGQTIAIGGLRKRNTSKDISKVPLLGDMPLVGGLFKAETESLEINELVVFITTRIMTEPALSEIERRQLKATELAPLPLPGDRNQITEMLDVLLEKTR